MSADAAAYRQQWSGDGMRRAWADPEKRARLVAGIRAACATPAGRERLAKSRAKANAARRLPAMTDAESRFYRKMKREFGAAIARREMGWT